jgi:RecA/RadA recombinase
MSQALQMTATISKTNTICIFINQLREKIGVMFVLEIQPNAKILCLRAPGYPPFGPDKTEKKPLETM